MQSTQFAEGQKETVTFSTVDSKGNPSLPLDSSNAPGWVSSDPTIMTVAPAADGLSAVLTAIKPGTAQITVNVPGSNTYQGFAAVFSATVVQNPPAGLVFIFGTPA